MLFIGSLIGICLLGYLAQTTGLCMVRGVNEWKAGNREFLLAILLSGVWAWSATLFSNYLDIPLKFRTYELSSWFILGGVLFGLGTAFNQGCGVSTLGKLARGDSKMIATIIGWLVGWSVLASLNLEIDLVQNKLPEQVAYIVLMVASLVITFWVFRGNTERKRLWFSMAGIGFLAGFLFLYEPKWPPSGLLNQLSGAIMNRGVEVRPSIYQYSLFIALLSGMFLAAWRTKKFQFVPSNFMHWVMHLLAGTLMGIGASLAMGGNDTQLLLSLPAFSPAGFCAVAGILLGIWGGLYIRETYQTITSRHKK